MLEPKDEVCAQCNVTINNLLLNKVSDLPLPPTYNMIKAVTLRGAHSSEKGG